MNLVGGSSMPAALNTSWTCMPSQGVSSFDHLVTQWMSRSWWVLGRALKPAQFHLATGFVQSAPFHSTVWYTVLVHLVSNSVSILSAASASLLMSSLASIPASPCAASRIMLVRSWTSAASESERELLHVISLFHRATRFL